PVFDDYERVYDDVIANYRPAANYRVLTNHDVITYLISLNDGERTDHRVHMRPLFIYLFPRAGSYVSIYIIDVLTVVAVIIVAILTDIEVIESDSKDFGSYGGKVLACAAYQIALALSTLDHEDYAVYKSRKDYRVTHIDQRRRVYDDEIEPFRQRAQNLFHV